MTRRAKLLALLDANAAFASVVNVRALRELDVPRGFCNRESRDFASLSYSNCIHPSRLGRDAPVSYSFRFASPRVSFRDIPRRQRNG